LQYEKYLLVGCGGTGTFLLEPLVRYLLTHYRKSDKRWELFVMDGDHVEEKNLDRQLFDEAAVTANKAAAATDKFEALNHVYAVPEYLGKDNIAENITDGSIVLIGVDNFPVRALIEAHCKTLNNVVVINGGNEVSTGSCQLWIRENGENITPVLSFLHPEVLKPGEDRSTMTCAQIAELDGGEQLITANMLSALWILSAVMQWHKAQGSDGIVKENIKWTELQFDLDKGESVGMDRRIIVGWNNVTN